MNIYYRRSSVSATEPTPSYTGEIWIMPTGGASYDIRIRIAGTWVPLAGGGVYEEQPNADNHYATVIVCDAEPSVTARDGWLWVSEALMQVCIYLGEWIPLTGGA